MTTEALRVAESELSNKRVQLNQEILENVQALGTTVTGYQKLHDKNKEVLSKVANDTADNITKIADLNAQIKRLEERHEQEKIQMFANPKIFSNPDYDRDRIRQKLSWQASSILRNAYATKNFSMLNDYNFKFKNEQETNDAVRFLASTNTFKNTPAESIKKNYIENSGTGVQENFSYVEGIGPQGGFYILPEYAPEEIVRQYETSPMRQLANVITVNNTNQVRIYGRDNLAASGGWVGEVQTRPLTDTQTTFIISIDLYEQYVNQRSSQVFAQDAPFDVASRIAATTLQTMTLQENSAWMVGDGSQKPTGILNYPTWNNTLYPIGSQNNYQREALEYIYSGTSGAFNYNSIVNLKNSLIEPYQDAAVFMTTRQGWAAILQILDTQGRPIYQQMNLLRDGTQGVLLGSPVVITSANSSTILNPQVTPSGMPAPVANGRCMLYGDFRSTYTILQHPGMVNIQDPYTDKPFIRFYTMSRVGGAVVNYQSMKGLSLSAAPSVGNTVKIKSLNKGTMINDVHHEGGPKELEPMHDVRSRHAEVNQLHDIVKKQHTKIEKLEALVSKFMKKKGS